MASGGIGIVSGLFVPDCRSGGIGRDDRLQGPRLTCLEGARTRQPRPGRNAGWARRGVSGPASKYLWKRTVN